MVSADGLFLPDIEKAGKTTTQEYAYARLHHALMVGSIAPGVPVTIRGLAQAMSISPTPIREALRRLSSKNALAVLENRRIVVPEMTRERFNELVSLRCAIETYAAERALPFISEVAINQIEKIDAKMDQAVDRQQREKLIVLNQEFHNAIYCANADQVSMPMIESIWLQLGPFMRIALQHIGTFYTIDRHKEIIGALRQRDLTALKQAIHADIHDAVGRFDDDALDKILGPAQ
jgi:DNA-binding GntR family transcriptional regulator